MIHAVVWSSVVFAAATLAAVVIERTLVGLSQIRQLRLEHRYGPLLDRALADDETALRALVASPPRHRIVIAYLLIEPLIQTRDPARVAASRRIAQAMSIVDIGRRYLRSRRWWRRALALRAVGLLQLRDQTATVVRALDDPYPEVRAAALDALADMADPSTVPAIVVRLLDASLERSRRAAALDTFGSEGELFVLELADLLPEYRVNYARALAICGTARARPTLCRWAAIERAEVRAAALSALGRIGLDDTSARVAVDGLQSGDTRVRASAARALLGWRGGLDASEPLARHLEDAWSVAVPAARSLQSMGDPGIARLAALASYPGLAGLLARQMLWETSERVS